MRQALFNPPTDFDRRWEQVPASGVIGGNVELAQLDGPSLVWIVDKLSLIIQKVCIQLKNRKDLRRIMVHVVDLDDLIALMKTPQYEFVFSDPRVRILWVDEGRPLLFGDLVTAFEPDAWDRDHPPEIQYAFSKPESEFQPLMGALRSLYWLLHEHHRISPPQLAHLLDAEKCVEHTLKNLPLMMQQYDLRQLRKSFASVPCLLVGAGPSLQNQMDFLRARADEFLIIAADTMLKPLSDAGITPEFICSIERDREIIGLLDDPRDHPTTMLVASSVVDPRALAAYRGPQSVYLAPDPRAPFYQLDRTHLTPGYSCMGLAMALASFLGASEIYLMGIDLSYGELGRSHMSGVPYLQTESFQAADQRLRQDLVPAFSNTGERVQMNKYWTIFQHQFQTWAKNQRATIYNLSPTGVRLAGAAYRSLKEVPQFPSKGALSEKIQKQMAYDLRMSHATYRALSDRSRRLSEQLRAATHPEARRTHLRPLFGPILDRVPASVSGFDEFLERAGGDLSRQLAQTASELQRLLKS